MGGGRSEGANPGPPNSYPFSGLRSVQSEGVISPLPRIEFATGIGYYGIFSGYFEDSFPELLDFSTRLIPSNASE